MTYQRMKYANERRDWVNTAALMVPEFEARAIASQHRSAKAYSFIRDYGKHAQPYMFQLAAEEAAEARRALTQALYYRGMAQANAE